MIKERSSSHQLSYLNDMIRQITKNETLKRFVAQTNQLTPLISLALLEYCQHVFCSNLEHIQINC